MWHGIRPGKVEEVAGDEVLIRILAEDLAAVSNHIRQIELKEDRTPAIYP